jgi:hypothetical protein
MLIGADSQQQWLQKEAKKKIILTQIPPSLISIMMQ